MNEKQLKLPVPREVSHTELQETRDALRIRAKRCGRYATACIISGLAISIGLTALLWMQVGKIVLWFGPIFVLCGLGGVALLQRMWKAQLEIEAIDRALRKHFHGTRQ